MEILASLWSHGTVVINIKNVGIFHILYVIISYIPYKRKLSRIITSRIFRKFVCFD